jgi:hypothetical protein
VTAPTRANTAGRAYLELRKKARADRRPVDELMQLYVLEAFLAGLAAARFSDRLVLKGGVLLAVFGERRPTASSSMLRRRPDQACTRGRASHPHPWRRDLRARIPLAMVHAEKIVTAISRGTTSTRWRDFADMYMLAKHHAIEGAELNTSILAVARHRETQLVPLGRALADYGRIGQQRWEAWRRRQRLEDRLPGQFSEVVTAVVAFADPAITGMAAGHSSDPAAGTWS